MICSDNHTLCLRKLKMIYIKKHSHGTPTIWIPTGRGIPSWDKQLLRFECSQVLLLNTITILCMNPHHQQKSDEQLHPYCTQVHRQPTNHAPGINPNYHNVNRGPKWDEYHSHACKCSGVHASTEPTPAWSPTARRNQTVMPITTQITPWHESLSQC